MRISDLLINAIALIALLNRIRVLYNSIRHKETNKIFFEILIIFLILIIWGLFYFKIL